MPRKGRIPRRRILPDPKYHDQLVARFINSIMRKGKKSLAERVCYGSFDIIGDKAKEDPVSVFKKAVGRIRPRVEVKSRRVGGATYQVPIEVREDRSLALALRWLIMYAKGRSGKNIREKLAEEILDAANDRGNAVKKREDTHRMAEANKAFSHYRW